MRDLAVAIVGRRIKEHGLLLLIRVSTGLEFLDMCSFGLFLESMLRYSVYEMEWLATLRRALWGMEVERIKGEIEKGLLVGVGGIGALLGYR